MKFEGLVNWFKNAVLPLEKKPVYRGWVQKFEGLNNIPEEQRVISIRYGLGERKADGELRLMNGRLALSVCSKGGKEFKSQGIDRGTFKMIERK